MPKSKSESKTGAEPLAQPPQVGNYYIYQPADGKGHGESHKGSELTAEMTALDLAPGTQVLVFEINVDTDWPILNWTDSVGIDRMTTFDPDEFAGDFSPV
jgi:hypothetical protein